MGKPICAASYIGGLLLFYTIFIWMQPSLIRPPALLTEKQKGSSSVAFLNDVQSLLPVALWVSYIFGRMWFITWSLIVESSHLDGVRRVGQQRVFDSTRVIIFG